MTLGDFYLVGFDTLVFGLFLFFSEIDEFLLHFISSEHINFAPESFVEIIIKFEIGVIPVQNTLREVQVDLKFSSYLNFKSLIESLTFQINKDSRKTKSGQSETCSNSGENSVEKEKII